MPRILHVISSLARHGTAKQLRLVAAGLATEGHDVHVCVLAGAPNAYEWCAALAEHGVDSTVLTQRTRADVSCLPALYRLIRQLQPDVVHTWLPIGNLFGRLAARAAGVKHVVSSLRDADPFVSRWNWPAERMLAGSTSAIVVNSHGVREHAVRHGIAPQKIHVIGNAVEIAKESCYSRDELFEQLQLPSDARLLGTMGPLVRSKNLKHLIWVVDIFKGIHEPVHLLVLGDGPQRARCELFAEQIEARHLVHFVGHRADARDILPHLDAYVCGSQHEGCSNGLLEAMAAGVPPVVTNISAHHDLVQHPQNGFHVPVGSRADVAKCVKKLLDDEQLAANMGTTAQTSVLARHSLKAMIEQYSALYKQIVQ
jgi:glycosyltransferase involved in cell wall biosynthesis